MLVSDQEPGLLCQAVLSTSVPSVTPQLPQLSWETCSWDVEEGLSQSRDMVAFPEAASEFSRQLVHELEIGGLIFLDMNSLFSWVLGSKFVLFSIFYSLAVFTQQILTHQVVISSTFQTPDTVYCCV